MITVKLCNDLTGWFATLSDDLAEYPGVTVHSEQAFETSAQALRALDLTQVLAQRLGGSPGLWAGAVRRPAPSNRAGSDRAALNRHVAVYLP